MLHLIHCLLFAFNKLNIINEELSAYSLSVSGCGIQLDEKGPQLNLELFYEDIRVEYNSFDTPQQLQRSEVKLIHLMKW